jgi:hypothetical protein
MRLLPLALLPLIALGGCKKTPPPAQAQAASSHAAQIKGKVLERIPGQGYTYLRLNTGKEELWVGVPASEATVGQDVVVLEPVRMEGFASKTLNRTFDVIYLGTMEGTAAAPHAGPPPQGMSPAATAPEPPDVKVDRAKGADARTVAELYAQKDGLKDKSVTVRGRVVKVNTGILGKNWVHLRDGSGTSDKKDNDLTVTTLDTVAVGDVVTAKGTVRVNKDFGSGYFYPVLVEDGRLAK